eukprot:883981-Pleurochrysis_carterae.AAC.1
MPPFLASRASAAFIRRFAALMAAAEFRNPECVQLDLGACLWIAHVGVRPDGGHPEHTLRVGALNGKRQRLPCRIVPYCGDAPAVEQLLWTPA